MKWGSFLTSKCSRMGGGMLRTSLVLRLGLPEPVAEAKPSSADSFFLPLPGAVEELAAVGADPCCTKALAF